MITGPAATGVSEQLQQFWQSLGHADMDAASKTLRLLDGTFFLGDSDVCGSSLYVREWYNVLEAGMKEHYDSGGRGIIIVGSPGVITSFRNTLDIVVSVCQYSTPHCQHTRTSMLVMMLPKSVAQSAVA